MQEHGCCVKRGRFQEELSWVILPLKTDTGAGAVLALLWVGLPHLSLHCPTHSFAHWHTPCTKDCSGLWPKPLTTRNLASSLGQEPYGKDGYTWKHCIELGFGWESWSHLFTLVSTLLASALFPKVVDKSLVQSYIIHFKDTGNGYSIILCLVVQDVCFS